MITIVDVCMIIITLSLVLLISGLYFIIVDLRKARRRTEEFMDNLEKELVPLIANLRTASDDIKTMSTTLRSQVEKVDLTTTTVSRNVNSVVEQWTRTATILHEAVDDSVMDIAAFIKGVSRGVKFFFGNGKNHMLR